MAQVLDIISWIMMLGGGAFVLVGGIGILRLPDLYTRMHAAGVTDSIAPILILSGIILQAGITLAGIKLAAILLFLLLTGPTATNALASAALLAGKRTEQAKPLQPESDQ